MVFTRDELAAIADLAVEHDLLVVTDEVYEHLVFDGEHIPIAALPGMRERTVSISSAGKTFSFTGWKIGWVKATPELVAAVRTAKQFLTFVSGGPFQYAVAAGAGPARRVLRQARAPTCTPSATCWPRGWASRLRGVRAAGHVLHHRRHPAAWATRTASSSAGPCRTAAAWSPSPPPSSTTTQEAARSQVRFAFCKRPEVLTEALARLSRLTG